ncbi:MAG: methyltransferase domain-containing protein [Ruminococcaceae bacterium]|nr:methyltransferase domain-containing protein [Oscillospiraceae bacterium]
MPNTNWSRYVQGIHTLYDSRKLRFNDLFTTQYLSLFALDRDKPLKILEIGCGPGALAAALHRWYPKAEITGMDRDSEFIAFAKEEVPGVTFLEGDATALPFPDNTFDVTISNTVSEHVEPSAFYGEQYRVLKPGGICLVLSARRGFNQDAPCLSPTQEENTFWKSIGEVDDSMERYQVCRYPMSEMELPQAMEQYGFIQVTTGYALIDLTPDHPRFSPALAHDMINAGRANDLEALDSAALSYPSLATPEKVARQKELVNARYNTRLSLYDQGLRQWDTHTSVTMVIRGVK